MDPWFELLVLLPFCLSFPFLYFFRSAGLMRIDRHWYRFFKGLEEDQRDTDQGKNPDDQVHTIIGN